jgi:hypothetical protein
MKSSLHHRLLAALLLAFSFAAAAPGPAAAQFGLNIHLGPQPPPRREYAGRPPHRGCFWVRGHYVARGHRWVWINGHWRCR